MENLPKLYLGSAEATQIAEELKKKGIRNIVRVLCNEDAQKIPDINYHIIPANDSEKESISQYFTAAIKLIHNALQSNEKVLVHCFKEYQEAQQLYWHI
ncbi:unnamed protein product [Blepharisma stoltei]|uniref:protein-tyrosine-phosphatase n=1 Tax=Blepharisma stoltei TaxID=1481888 RepID=A0AAU9JZ34_9CILI|nr:unnamed protein product [Blepharisma stoltei]